MILQVGITDEVVCLSNGKLSFIKDLDIWDGPTANGHDYSVRIAAILFSIYPDNEAKINNEFSEYLLVEIEDERFEKTVEIVRDEINAKCNHLESARTHRNEFKMVTLALSNKLSDIEDYINGKEVNWRQTVIM